MSEREPKPPKMVRSRTQLLTSYAPGAYFPFEGGAGICCSVVKSYAPADLRESVELDMIERVRESIESWLRRGMAARPSGNDKSVVPQQCVERQALSSDLVGVRPDLSSIFEFCVPQVMGYKPAPTTMYNAQCKLVRWYPDMVELHRDLRSLSGGDCMHPLGPESNGCRYDGGRFPCKWRQLDVMFVHWSGHVEAAGPFRWEWDNENGCIKRLMSRCDSCGSEVFTLDRSNPRIGEWRFICARCMCPKSQEGWRQNDPVTLRIFRSSSPDSGRMGEVRMMAVPCMASFVFYPQVDRVIEFPDRSENIHSCLRVGPAAREQLKQLLASRFGYVTGALSNEEIVSIVQGLPSEAGYLDEFQEKMEDLADYMEELPRLRGAQIEECKKRIVKLEAGLERLKRAWIDRGVIHPPAELPDALNILLDVHGERFSPRFDPIRLAVEHAAFEEHTLKAARMADGKRKFVPFTSPDEDIEHMSFAGRESEVKDHLDLLGLEDMGLIRHFHLRQFTYGYSRVSAGPVTEKHNMYMPVRLNFFDQPTGGSEGKRPIYTLSQQNEAIYVRLKETAVAEWLVRVGCAESDDIQERGVRKVVLETSLDNPLNLFLDGLPVGDSNPPRAWLLTYALLHTYAHHVLCRTSDLAGLDLGSLGEYIFPADLAFVVYRSGMTMDLGNISAMWRNNGRFFLYSLLDKKSFSCGLGTLCSERGGACPDCLMIPEIACLTGNKLLSRSLFTGNGMTREYRRPNGPFPSFYDAARVVMDKERAV